MSRKKSRAHRTIKLRPYIAIDPKSGEVLDLKSVLRNIASDVKTATEIAEWHVDYRLREDVDDAVKNNRVPSNLNALGRELGVFAPDYITEDWRSGRSRFSVLVQDRAIREALSWNERFNTRLGKSVKYVSQGWKRTADWSRPANLVPKVSLSAADAQYSALEYDEDAEELHLRMVVSGNWTALIFKLDNKRHRGASKICKPDIVISKEGNPDFYFALEFPYTHTLFSERFVVGIDVGIVQYVTYSVYDLANEKVVEYGTGSRRVHSLWNKVKKANAQVSSLQKKGREKEALLHREANSRRKKELAILVGREIAEISLKYNNALVAIEDLSWIANTMQNGRWNRGTAVKWITDSVELNGGRVMKVSASQTSQTCSNCDYLGVSHRKKRLIHCPLCTFTADRDVNASTNIAKRLVLSGVLSKCVATRKKSKKATKKVVKRTRGGDGKNLRYPGTYKKNKPTPKRPKKEVKRRFVKPRSSARDNDDLTKVALGAMRHKEETHCSIREDSLKTGVDNTPMMYYSHYRICQ